MFRVTKYGGYGANITDNKTYDTYSEAWAEIGKIKDSYEKAEHFIEMSCDGKEWFALA